MPDPWSEPSYIVETTARLCQASRKGSVWEPNDGRQSMHMFPFSYARHKALRNDLAETIPPPEASHIIEPLMPM